MGVSWGGGIYKWKSPAPITAIVLGVFLLVALFIYEYYMDLEYSAIPIKLFPNRGFMSLVCCATIATVCPAPPIARVVTLNLKFRCSTTRHCYSGLNKSQSSLLLILHMRGGYL